MIESPRTRSAEAATPDRARRDRAAAAVADIQRRWGFTSLTRLGSVAPAGQSESTRQDRTQPVDAPPWWPRPRGTRPRLVEIVAPASSGGLSLALLWGAACSGNELAAIIDPPVERPAGRFYPPAAALCGLSLDRLVIVSPPSVDDAIEAAMLLTRCEGFGFVLLRLPATAVRAIPSVKAGKLALLAARAGTTLLCLIQTNTAAEADISALGGFVDYRLHVQRGGWIWEDGELVGTRLNVVVDRARAAGDDIAHELTVRFDGGRLDGNTSSRLRLAAALLIGERASEADQRRRLLSRALQPRLALA